MTNILKLTLHGNNGDSSAKEEFRLDINERVSKVQVVVLSGQLGLYIHGVRFFTTYGQTSQSIDSIGGTIQTEEFDGYILGYVTGRSGLWIDQLQFHWYEGV